MRCRLTCLAMMLVVCAAVVPAQASRFVTLSLDQMIRRSAVIVEGDVIATRSAWTARRDRIYTTVTLKVHQVHKGVLGGQTLDLQLLGGTVGEITMAVPGQPAFVDGENVFLFLAPNYDTQDIPFVGGEAGKMRVVADMLLGARETREKLDVTREIQSVLRPIGQ